MDISTLMLIIPLMTTSTSGASSMTNSTTTLETFKLLSRLPVPPNHNRSSQEGKEAERITILVGLARLVVVAWYIQLYVTRFFT
eukprot:m.141921 g.141921  ORF g.141921 m.141921 type:complete len:84 (+) comp22890_c1_seq2:692-943(+)